MTEIRPDAPADLIAYARELGVEDFDLDEAIHEVYESRASDVNNQGIEGQLSVLADEYTPDVARLVIKGAVENR